MTDDSFFFYRVPKAPFRAGFRLGLPKVFHRFYCDEILGRPGGGASRVALPDPEGHFGKCRDLLSEARLEPYVLFSGEKKDFGQVKDGDHVRVVAAIEPFRTQSPNLLGLELILKKIVINPRQVSGPKRRKLGLVESVEL